MKENYCLVKSNAKVSPKSSGDSSVQVSSFKVNNYLHRFLLKPQPWKSGKVKHEIITWNWKDELPHKLPNDLRLRMLGNEEILKLFTWVLHWLNNSSTRRFKLVNCRCGFVNCGFELVIRGFKLITRRFELVTRGFKLITRRSKLVTCTAELVTREFELLDLNL